MKKLIVCMLIIMGIQVPTLDAQITKFKRIELKEFVRSEKTKRLINEYDKRTTFYHSRRNKETRERLELYQHTLRGSIEDKLWQEWGDGPFTHAILIQLRNQMDPRKSNKKTSLIAGYTKKSKKELFIEKINSSKKMRKRIFT